MTALVETQSLYVAIGAKRFPVTTLADASALFCKTRDAFGEGASKTPQCKVVDQRGEVVARISYNGRIWPNAEWFDGMVPLYDNR
jgi:hypothetical protein